MGEFVPLRFRVVLYAEDESRILCGGHFSEVSGLEVTMEPHAIAEGGRNWGEHQRSGRARFAPVVLKRGVTSVNDLWSWFDVTTRRSNYGYRLQGRIEVMGNPSAETDGRGTLIEVKADPILSWKLHEVLPTKFKGPDLSATASQVAIEELHLVHEGLELERLASTGGENSRQEGQG